MDEFTKKRLYREFEDDKLMDLYITVFEVSKQKPWLQPPHNVELHKAVIYETLNLVRRWSNGESVSDMLKEEKTTTGSH